jgi:DNA end-binding protein Ku
MADHAVWRGHLRLALVSCPVALYPARREANNLHFHLINPATGHRVRMVTLDAETDAEVSRRDLVKGYEFKKDTYLILDDEDFDAARIESSSTLSITKFVTAESIDPLYYDSSYYMVPDGKDGEDVFAVLREAFAQTKRVALSRVVIGRRERAVAIMPMGEGLVAHTLYEARDINDAGRLFGTVKAGKSDPEMVALAVQLIGRQSGVYAPDADNEDRYETRLREVIDAKLKGEGVEPEESEAEDRSNVVDLMAMLKQSLGGEAKAAKPKATPVAKAKPKPAPGKPKAAASAKASPRRKAS